MGCMQYVGLLDCNNFFVSCERLFRPDLEHKPVVVLSGNDGCVVARSNEVKALGIPMGIPYFKVKPDIAAAQVTCFSSNFTLYRDISKRVMDTLRELATAVEVYSIDEAFFALSATDEVEAQQKLVAIKRQLEQSIGIPISVGAAKTKTIAKYASEYAKTAARAGAGEGVAVLDGTRWRTLQVEVPVSAIWGVGAQLAQKFRAHDIVTVADVVQADPARVAQLFGVVGTRLQAELSESAIWRLGSRAESPQKSIMSTRSFGATTTTQAVVADAVAFHVSHAAAELRSLGLRCRYLEVIARPSRYSDWVLQQGSAECVLLEPTSDTLVLLRQAQALLKSFWQTGVPYKKAGVVLGMFSDATVVQPDLFASTQTQTDTSALLETIDELNQRFGSGTIETGRQVRTQAWRPQRNKLSPHYTTNWQQIATVKG